MNNDTLKIIKDGLWTNNPALVQVLGLCPSLAVTSTLTNALGLGLASLFVLTGSNLCVSLARNFIPSALRIPIFVMIIASLVTCVQLLMNAFAHGLYQSLGIFIALIVTNCVIIGRAEAFASKNTPALAALDGFMMGLGFTCVLIVLGAIREILGQGTLFDGAEQLLGPWASSLRMEILPNETGFLLALLPPGAFIALGFLIALKNKINTEIARRSPEIEPEKIERVRVTQL